MTTLTFLTLLLGLSTTLALTPSSNFTAASFVGNWNIAAYYSTPSVNIDFYSCATYNVTSETLTRLSLTYRFLDTQTLTYNSQTNTVVPDPLQPGILVSVEAPGPQSNFVVVYYDNAAGQAVLINPALTTIFFLSKSANPYANNYRQIISQQLIAVNLTTDFVTFVFNNNCNYGALVPIPGFNPATVNGTYYANAIYSNIDTFLNVQALSGSVSNSGSIYAVSINLEYSSSKIIQTGLTFLPNPDTASVLINLSGRNLPPLVAIYSNNGTTLFASGDGAFAFVQSASESLPASEVTAVKAALATNGMKVSATNFYVLSYSTEEEKAISA